MLGKGSLSWPVYCLFIWLFVCMSVCQSASLFVCLFRFVLFAFVLFCFSWLPCWQTQIVFRVFGDVTLHCLLSFHHQVELRLRECSSPACLRLTSCCSERTYTYQSQLEPNGRIQNQQVPPSLERVLGLLGVCLCTNLNNLGMEMENGRSWCRMACFPTNKTTRVAQHWGTDFQIESF